MESQTTNTRTLSSEYLVGVALTLLLVSPLQGSVYREVNLRNLYSQPEELVLEDRLRKSA